MIQSVHKPWKNYHVCFSNNPSFVWRVLTQHNPSFVWGVLIQQPQEARNTEAGPPTVGAGQRRVNKGKLGQPGESSQDRHRTMDTSNHLDLELWWPGSKFVNGYYRKDVGI